MLSRWLVASKLNNTDKKRIADKMFGGGTAKWGGIRGSYIELVGLETAEESQIQQDLGYDDDWKQFTVWSNSCGSGTLAFTVGTRYPCTCDPRSTALHNGFNFLGIIGSISPSALEAKKITLLIIHDNEGLGKDEIVVELVDDTNPLDCGIQEIDDWVNDFHSSGDPVLFVELRELLG